MKYCVSYNTGDLFSVVAGVVDTLTQTVTYGIYVPFSKGFNKFRIDSIIISMDCQNNVVLSEAQVQVKFDWLQGSNTFLSWGNIGNSMGQLPGFKTSVRWGQSFQLNTGGLIISPGAIGYGSDQLTLRSEFQMHLIGAGSGNYNVGVDITFIGELLQ